jgi:hypothetical protein
VLTMEEDMYRNHYLSLGKMPRLNDFLVCIYISSTTTYFNEFFNRLKHESNALSYFTMPNCYLNSHI